MKRLKEIINESKEENLEKHYQHSQEDASYFASYSGGSNSINNYLWNKPESYPKDIKHNVTAHIEKLDSALSKYKAPKPLTVYSGAYSDPRKRMNENGIVSHPGYLSTSLSKHIANGFAKGNSYSGATTHLLKIKIPKGHPGAYIGHISRLPEEKEFILPRGLNLKHIKTETTFKKNGEDSVNIHHMEIV